MTKKEFEVDAVRRRLVQGLLATPVLALVADTRLFAASIRTAPTLACDDDDEPTPQQTEGPYFKPSSPLRASLLEAGMGGSRLTLAGKVLNLACAPIGGALLDFWQADEGGTYDNAGYRLRGHQFTATDGTFTLETIVPGAYAGRTRHIHVKVQAPNQRILTTQLYFPGEPRNSGDRIFKTSLVMDMRGAGSARQATFNFVLNVS